MEKRKETEPFTELEKSDLKGVTSKLFTVPGHEDIVVRKSFVNVPYEKREEWESKYANLSEEEKRKMMIYERMEYLRNKAVEFKKIIDRLGIRMAKTDYVIGTDTKTDKPALFGATERIEGKSLEEITLLDKDLAEKVDNLYAKIIIDLVESYKKELYFWCDPQNSQFVYGKTEKDNKQDIYLVDVDPDILNWKDVAMENKEHLFWNRLTCILFEMEEAEGKTDEKGFRFKKAREAVEKAKTEIFDMI